MSLMHGTGNTQYAMPAGTRDTRRITSHAGKTRRGYHCLVGASKRRKQGVKQHERCIKVKKAQESQESKEVRRDEAPED